MLRELAQFSHAVRSPVASVEVQQYRVATLFRKPEVFPILVFESEIRRHLPLGHGRLGLGIRFALAECQCRRKEEETEDNPAFHAGKDTRITLQVTKTALIRFLGDG